MTGNEDVMYDADRQTGSCAGHLCGLVATPVLWDEMGKNGRLVCQDDGVVCSCVVGVVLWVLP